jgi:hypothetical protein
MTRSTCWHANRRRHTSARAHSHCGTSARIQLCTGSGRMCPRRIPALHRMSGLSIPGTRRFSGFRGIARGAASGRYRPPRRRTGSSSSDRALRPASTSWRVAGWSAHELAACMHTGCRSRRSIVNGRVQRLPTPPGLLRSGPALPSARAHRQHRRSVAAVSVAIAALALAISTMVARYCGHGDNAAYRELSAGLNGHDGPPS